MGEGTCCSCMVHPLNVGEHPQTARALERPLPQCSTAVCEIEYKTRFRGGDSGWVLPAAGITFAAVSCTPDGCHERRYPSACPAARGAAARSLSLTNCFVRLCAHLCLAVTCDRPDGGQPIKITYKVAPGRGWMVYELWLPPRARNAVQRTDTCRFAQGVLTPDGRSGACTPPMELHRRL